MRKLERGSFIFFALVPTFSTNSGGNACYAGYVPNLIITAWVIRTEARQKHEFRRRDRVELHFRVSSIKSVVTETKSWSQIPRKIQFPKFMNLVRQAHKHDVWITAVPDLESCSISSAAELVRELCSAKPKSKLLFRHRASAVLLSNLIQLLSLDDRSTIYELGLKMNTAR